MVVEHYYVGNKPTNIRDATIQVPTQIQSHFEANITAASSSARTASGNSDDIDVEDYKSIGVMVDVTAASGTSPTLDIYLEGKDQLSGKYHVIWNPSTISSVTTASTILTDIPYKYIRVRWVIGGTSPSFTFSVGLEVKA